MCRGATRKSPIRVIREADRPSITKRIARRGELFDVDAFDAGYFLPFPGRTRYTATTGGERERERESPSNRYESKEGKGSREEVVDSSKSWKNRGRSDSDVVDPFVRRVRNSGIGKLTVE